MELSDDGHKIRRKSDISSNDEETYRVLRSLSQIYA